MNRKAAILAGAVGALLIAVVAIAAIVIFSRGGGGEDTQASRSGGGARVAGELRMPGGDPLTLDPALTADTDSATYVVEIFSGLVQLDKNLKVIPDIAREWTVSDDGKTYTFKLRDDATFQNSGRKVTAQDFKWSMERAANPATNSPVAETYLGDIVGAKDMITGKAREISGLRVVDDATLQITLTDPVPFFVQKLTYPTAYVVDREQVERDPRQWSSRPNGTGPFKLQEWRAGERVVLVPNERYYGEPKPKLSKVTFNLAGGSVLTQYENGEVDVAGVGVNDIERIRDTSERLNKEFTETPDLSISYIAFNTQKAPFDDPKVRQAFAMAIDKKRITDVILKNIILPADQILPPGMPGHNKNEKGLEFNAQRARQLLQESRYQGRLPRVVMTLSGTGTNLGPVTEAWLEMWKQNLGVDVEVEQVETATFFQDVNAGKYQMWAMGWSADYPDPENFLDIHFASDSSHNDTGYKNERVDQLLKQARTERNNETRMRLYQEAQSLILQDAPWAPLFFSQSAVLVKPYVQGWEPTPLIIPILKYVSVSR
jgi:oligopeptide transport system substrate-binding protein